MPTPSLAVVDLLSLSLTQWSFRQGTSRVLGARNWKILLYTVYYGRLFHSSSRRFTILTLNLETERLKCCTKKREILFDTRVNLFLGCLLMHPFPEHVLYDTISPKSFLTLVCTFTPYSRQRIPLLLHLVPAIKNHDDGIRIYVGFETTILHQTFY